MRIVSWVFIVWLAAPTLVLGQAGLSAPAFYTGMCDASAAAALDGDRVVVANDEDNLLRLYSRSRPGPPVSSLDLSGFLQVTDKSPETDIEGSARIGDRIFWITSHGRNASGKHSPNRHRFFATDIVAATNGTTLAPVGLPYRHLLRDLAREPKLARFNLGRAAERAPKDRGALNIEGLAAAPEGHLLIGFRNPIPEGKALLVPLLNPRALLEGTAASFGDPILLDLGGLGIRSIEFHQGRYVIIAGHYDSGASSRLYLWTGNERPPRWIKDIDFGTLNPEGMIFPDPSKAAHFELVSDDGTVAIGGKPCKDLKDPARKHFRTYAVDVDAR